jgi:hypothetical protein
MSSAMNSSLQQARSLIVPSREHVLHRHPSVRHFWHSQKSLLEAAWKEWDAEQGNSAPSPHSLIDPTLRATVATALKERTPQAEEAVRALWKEVAPKVFAVQFFDVEKLPQLRQYLAQTEEAGIPTRQPYGIVLNRGGAMIDSRSEGYLAAPSFQAIYRALIDTYMRPMGRLLYPEIAGFDDQSFGFSIHYEPSTDQAIRQHSDASTTTLNINMNLPTEEYSGSELYFLDQNYSKYSYRFTPGVAVLHRGAVPHAALPITSGSRSNLVLWLYGKDGRTPSSYAETTVTSSLPWWAPSNEPQDSYTPF